MAETTYTYSVASDMPGGAVNIGKLADEIQASSIVTALERIDLAGDVLDVIFKDALSAGDKTTFDGDTTGPAGGLLAAHDNTASLPDTQTVKLDTTEKHIVEIQEVSPGPLSYRNSPLPLIDIDNPATEGSCVLSWPYDFHLLSIEYYSGTGSGAVIGDTISAEVDPDRDLSGILGAAGQLQVNETTADDEVEVHPAAIAAGLLQPGYFVKFAGSGNPEYEIVSIDTTTNLMKLDRNLDNARTAGDAIFRTIPMGRDIWVMPCNVPHVYGETKIGASKIPAGWQLKITYKAVDANGRDIVVNAEGGVYEA